MSRPWCLYYIQGEEGENPDEPNAFPVMGSGDVTLKQLLASFPLDKGGAYHFRFKAKDDRFGYAWQDVKDVNATIPVANGLIYAKVLRLDQPPKPASRLRRKPMLPSGYHGAAHRPPPPLSRKGSSGSIQQEGRRNNSAGGSFTSPMQSPSPSYATSPSTSTSSSAAAMGGRRASGSTPTGRSTTPSTPVEPTITRVGTPTTAGGGGRPSSRSNTPSGASSSNTNGGGGTPSNRGGIGGGGNSNFIDISSGSTTAKSSSSSSPPPPPRPPKAGEDLDSFLYGGGGGGPAPTKPTSAGSRPGSSLAGNNSSSGNGLFDMDDVIPSNGGAANVRSRSSTPAPRANTPLAPGSVGLDIDEDTPSGPAKATAAATAANGGAPPSQEDMFFMQQATEKDVKEATEEAALDAVRVRLGPKLKEWATDPQSGKLRNVRTLLSTMQTVLWDGCTWKAVFLGDLMAPDRVKFHYRKAMLVLHPDKNVNGSLEQRFVAERVFTSVNEAYTTFAAQELK